MRLSIECSGCKATLTSGSNIDPATPKKEKKPGSNFDPATPKKEKKPGSNFDPATPKREKKPKTSKKKELTVKREGRCSPPSSSSSRNCEIKKNVNSNTKKSLSLSDYLHLRSPSSDCFASDLEDEIETRLSSSMGFSSEYSSKYYNNNNVMKSKKKKEKTAAVAVTVDRGVAVVEQSSDPYGDFRRSMVEMIMARPKLRDGDLNHLLRSYLSLNPPQHHPVILKAFTDLYMGSSIEQQLIS